MQIDHWKLEPAFVGRQASWMSLRSRNFVMRVNYRVMNSRLSWDVPSGMTLATPVGVDLQQTQIPPIQCRVCGARVKLWIDELPMFINYFKGQMKLVGVRPLSSHYFNLYPEDIQELRTKVRPGLFPPFYADLPETLEEIIDSERRYLEAYMKETVLTDLRYFFKALYNIIIKKARSK